MRYLLYGGLGPLTQELYNNGFSDFDGGSLDKFLGEQSQLPEMVAAGGALLASYKAGKAIDGCLPKPLQGSVQTLGYAGLIAATFALGAYANPNADPDSINYISTAVNNAKEVVSVFSDGNAAPLMYTVLYGGLLTGAARWAKNAIGYAVELTAGKPGPSKKGAQD